MVVRSWRVTGLMVCTVLAGAISWAALVEGQSPSGPSQPAVNATPAANQSPRDSSNAPPEDGQWPMAGKNYANTRYSGLDQITTHNVQNLKLAWTFDTKVHRGQEAAPVVIGHMMFVVTPYPNIVYAFDLTQPGKPKWTYDPKPSAMAKGVACCDWVNRGVAYDNGKVFFNTLDCHTIALDAQTGKQLWKTKLGEINLGETMTMAPLVVKGKVLVGNSGGEYGVRGWITAVDENTGQIAWRAYSTGPDRDCLIGEKFKPFYKTDQGKDLGVTTWPPDHWQIGGGTVWGFVSYDPELDLLYYGTANPGSWNPELRPGDNKWAAGIFARDPETGQAHWFYQWSHHDLFDHDGINENVLADLTIDGKPRKVLMHPDRNGYLYVLDRATGEVLSATPFVRVNAYKGVDLKTGRIIPNPSKEPKIGTVVRDISPASPGAKDWQPMCFSPRTKWLYIPHQNLAMDYEATEAGYIAGTPYVGVNEKMYPGPGGYRGKLSAWDPVAKKEVWGIKENFPVWSGTVVTAGDVVFYGTMDRYFKAVDAHSGKELWKFETESSVIGQPVTYRGPDGKQYVAVLSGVGGWAGALVAADLNANDATAATGFAHAMKDLPSATGKGSTLYVFALP